MQVPYPDFKVEIAKKRAKAEMYQQISSSFAVELYGEPPLVKNGILVQRGSPPNLSKVSKLIHFLGIV